MEDPIFIELTRILVRIMAMPFLSQSRHHIPTKNIGDRIMRKIFLTVLLSLALVASSFAGDTPIMGVAGCAPGLWYPESQVCVPQLSFPVETPKPERLTIFDALAIQAFLHIQDIIF
jgi:hypothetical protein